MSSSSGWFPVRRRRGRDTYNRYPAVQSYNDESWYRKSVDIAQEQNEEELLIQDLDADRNADAFLGAEAAPGQVVLYEPPERRAYGHRYQPVGYRDMRGNTIILRRELPGRDYRTRETMGGLRHKAAGGKQFG